ncbi:MULTISPECIES: hypothetical protein [Methylobacterium]|uniref:Uncharacterized protein n=1 Tax=Methylobacterium jeotgali TaxID=381630 RepID=A0ABQ4SV80_9HYPH|nr:MULTISPECIES: hypothetical protein [Methylobacterium]GBU18810.1 hypothetical protein AwMethylo_30250 [Methylobacterium sp.]GJE07082.1 hypothetical protein AOPFMNJM_2406 [Methylobacterium jeotgali]
MANNPLAYSANPSVSVSELLFGKRTQHRARGAYMTAEREGRAADALVKRLERLAAGPAPDHLVHRRRGRAGQAGVAGRRHLP